mmetsp:Transcript_55079/g.159496  ORF Transcript_55079/g.159496 Transcript_55079/m.159496 type:complete len:86 (+) Transcript_55079:1489-1746(+)
MEGLILFRILLDNFVLMNFIQREFTQRRRSSAVLLPGILPMRMAHHCPGGRVIGRQILLFLLWRHSDLLLCCLVRTPKIWNCEAW